MRNLTFIFSTVFLFCTLQAQVINVPADTASIQGAIHLAANGDTVLVQPGTYIENIDFLGKNIVIGSRMLSDQDTSYISQTIIDGGGADSSQSAVSFISGENNSAALIGFTITNGWAIAAQAGGISLRNNSAPRIEDCRITANSGHSSQINGIGIYCTNSSPVFRRCSISNNSLSNNGNWDHHGGGIYIGESSAPEFYDCDFTDNNLAASIYFRDRGAAVFTNNSNASFNNCLFSGNSADDGGAISADNFSSLSFYNCVFKENSARSNGGALRIINSSQATIDSCLIYQNSATNGGGLYTTLSGTAHVSQSTLTENSASSGAAVYASTVSSVTLNNSIVYYNWYNEIFPADIDSVSYCNVRGGYTGTANIDVDPLFCDWINNDYHLADNSLSLTSGSNGEHIGFYGSGCSSLFPQTRQVPAQYATIQQAINASYQGDTILVANGSYTENIHFWGRRIFVTSNFHFSGDSVDISQTIINGGGVDSNMSVVSFTSSEDSTSVLKGFTISNGWASGSHGGGITITNNSNPLIADCRIINNSGTSSWLYGIGIYCTNSAPVFRRCEISGNSVSANGNYDHRGAGLYAASSAAPEFYDCTFVNNTMAPSIYFRDWGGAVYSDNSSPSFNNCLFSGNSADQGGAITADNFSSAYFYNCIFRDNNARSNGAVINVLNSAHVRADSCVIYKNSAAMNGGAVYTNLNGMVYLTKSTLTENSAALGAAIYANTANSVMARDCIIFYNLSNEIFPTNLDSVTYCNIRGGYTGTGNIDFDPLFCDWLDNNYQLATNSSSLTSGFNGSKMGYYGSGCAAVYAQTRHVPVQYPTIQNAIDASHQGDTVMVANGTYTENIQFLGKRVFVTSNFHSSGDSVDVSQTIINGGGVDSNMSVVSFTSSEDNMSALKGFTITNGWASGTHGGGISVTNNSSPHIEDCRIVFNSGTSSQFYGLGIYCTASSPVFRRCLISNNSVSSNGNYDHRGGGLYIAASQAAQFIDCDFIDNNLAPSIYFRDWGGAVFSTNSTLEFSNCTFSGNRSDDGAAMDISNSSNVTISNCSFTDNHSRRTGGAISSNNSSLNVYNSRIVYNTAGSDGGGVYLLNQPNDSVIIFLNNTFSQNMAVANGGAIFSQNANPVIINTIAWNDSATAGSEIFTNNATPQVFYSNINGGWQGMNNIDENPMFTDSIDFFLDELSTSIDAGHPDSLFNDREDPFNPGFALWPAQGALRNDMGAYGGPGVIGWENIITSLGSFSNTTAVPDKFELGQNYPNPFNPVTTIEYQVPLNSDIKLAVYNILGKHITTLFAGNHAAGYYKVDWDASGYSSGMYFYRLETNKGFVQTRKLILLK